MRRILAPVLLLLALAACGSDDQPVAIRTTGDTTTTATTPPTSTTEAVTPTTAAAPEPTTTVLVPGSENDPYGPILCPGLSHPAHHKPCPVAAAPNNAPAASRPSSSGSAPAGVTPLPSSGGGLDCGGDLPSCAIMKVESRGPGYPNGGDPNAVNPTGCGGRGCYGKWQFDPATSRGLGYDKTMDQYPVEVQDEAARQAKIENPCAWGC